MGAEQIDPTRDRVWAVNVSVTYTTYVVAEDASEAERIAEDEHDDDEGLFDDAPIDCYASEITEPIDPLDDGDNIVPYGRPRWKDRELTVNEAVELVARRRPVYDDQTLLMPFADSPPPLYPPRIEDYLASGSSA